MASDAHVVLVDPADGAEQYARHRLEELERRWSRFRPASDVSRLNETPEAFVVVSRDTIQLLHAMKQAWSLTGGRYDPTLLAAINAAGYSRSHDGSGRRSSSAGSAASACSIADVALHPAASAVVVPAGLGIDPGGIGKGLAADLVVTELLDRGTAGALVCVGGDLAAAGRPPEADGWQVAVEHPFDASREHVRVRLGAGGVATSSTLTRTWIRDGEPVSPRHRPGHRRVRDHGPRRRDGVRARRLGGRGARHRGPALGRRPGARLSRAPRPRRDRGDARRNDDLDSGAAVRR